MKICKLDGKSLEISRFLLVLLDNLCSIIYTQYIIYIEMAGSEAALN